MTLKQAIARVKTKVEIDLDSAVNLDDTTVATTEIMNAAREVSRDTYFLFDAEVALTIANNDQEIDLFTSQCARDVFDLRATEYDAVGSVHLNGGWIPYYEWPRFRNSFSGYHSATAKSRPSAYTVIAPSTILLAEPANSTLAAATDNFVSGYYLHDEYTWVTNQDTELQGPQEFHDLIVRKAALNVSEDYIDGEGVQRWQMVDNVYQRKAAKFKAFNLAKYRPLTHQPTAGMERRIFTIGGGLG